MLIPVFLRKVTKYEANGKKRMHQLRLFPAATISLAPVPPLAHNCSSTSTHARHHTHAPSTSIYTHWRHHSRASAPPHLRIRATTLTQPASTPLRTSATTLTHPRHHTHAPSSSLPSFGTYQNQSEFSRAYPISSEKFR